jgi:hypothetical protein
MEGTTEPGFRATPEQWEILLGEYSASGKSIRRFSRERGIPHTQLSYHLRRVRNAHKEHGFIELVQEAVAGKIWIEAGNCRIHVERGFDGFLLKQVVEALS